MQNNFEFVVARYKEDINWLNNFKDAKITVYNKFYKENVVLNNVGREAHTYLYHIVKNYDNLKKYIIFTQGDPIAHSPNFLKNVKNLMVNPVDKFKYLGEKIRIKSLNQNFSNLKYRFNHRDHPVIYILKNYSPIHLQYEFINTDYKSNIKFSVSNSLIIKKPKSRILISNKNSVEYMAGAIFVTSSDIIYKKPKEYYQKILRDPILELETNICPISAYALERIWHYILE